MVCVGLPIFAPVPLDEKIPEMAPNGAKRFSVSTISPYSIIVGDDQTKRWFCFAATICTATGSLFSAIIIRDQLDDFQRYGYEG